MEHLMYYVIFSLCVWECLEALYFKKEVLENASTKNEEMFIPVFKSEEKSYYVGELKLTYLEADQFCKNIDMRLVTIQSSEEFETLWSYIQNTCNERKFWSSGARLLDGDNWIWMSTLENVEFTKWKPGKPNNNTNEQCLEFLSDDNTNFVFNDKNCHEKNAFICEKDNRRQIKQEGDNSKHTYASQNSCGPPNINLMHFEGKNYYMGNNFETTFLEGIQFCQMIHMQLVSVDTEAENNRLHKYIRDTMAGHSFWSSGTRAIDGKTWVWLSTGTPIEFTQWEKNQPNHAEQQCIELVEHKDEGLFWNDDDCNDKHFFICESYDEYPLFKIGSTYSRTRTARSADVYTYQYESKQDKTQEEAKHKAKEEADKRAKEEAYNKAKAEAEKEAKKESERKAKEEADKKAKEEAEKKAKEEAEKKAKEEADKKTKEEVEKKTKEEAEKKTKEEAEKKAKEEIEKKTKEEAERKAEEEAEKKEKEKEENKEKEKAEKKEKEKAEKKEKEKAEKKNKEKAEKKEKEKAEKKEKEKKSENKEKEEKNKKDKKEEQKKDVLKYEITLDGGHYRFSNIKVNHEEAAQTCKQYGMELISIPNEKKDVFVNNLIKDYGKSDGKYWTSGTKKSDDQWIWGDLQPITYFNWAPSEPDSDQYCLQVRATGLWHDQDCDRNSLFICESGSYSASSYSDTYTYQANVEPYYSSSY